jgi:glycosyltransferase involved in cell wall biosynthesis
VRLAVAARQLPEAGGTAAGRALKAWCDGVVAEGHQLEVWSWSPEPPAGELPAWCRWRPLPEEARARTRARALVRPRSDIDAAAWDAPADAIAIADDVPSFATVSKHRHSVATLHYRTSIDAAALRRRSLRDVQDRRAERRAATGAWLPLAYSARAASAARGRGRTIPIAHEIPAAPVPFVDEPLVALVADWRWAPNRTALATLLRMWPDIQGRVSGARLLLAGRGAHLATIAPSATIEVLGEVARSEDVLARAALVAFPCPPTSGPKIKVLEALALGVPVVTTAAGVEGLFIADAAADVAAAEHEFADRVVTLLSDPPRRADMATRARAAVAAVHAPGPAARARIGAIEAALAFERPTAPR